MLRVSQESEVVKCLEHLQLASSAAGDTGSELKLFSLLCLVLRACVTTLKGFISESDSFDSSTPNKTTNNEDTQGSSKPPMEPNGPGRSLTESKGPNNGPVGHQKRYKGDTKESTTRRRRRRRSHPVK